MRTFDKEYKIMAVNRVKAGEKSAADVARELDLSPTTLYGWIRKFGKHGDSLPAAVTCTRLTMSYVGYAKKI